MEVRVCLCALAPVRSSPHFQDHPTADVPLQSCAITEFFFFFLTPLSFLFIPTPSLTSLFSISMSLGIFRFHTYLKSYTICLFLTDLFHLTFSRSIRVVKNGRISFLWPNSITSFFSICW